MKRQSVAERCMSAVFLSPSVVKFVSGSRSSAMLISSGQQQCQNFPEINVKQPWKHSNLTHEIKQHLADWQRSGFQTYV